jgi:hypothetical protein
MEPLLGKDLETSNRYSCCYAIDNQMAISEEWLGKHVPTETNIHATIEEQCFQRGPCRDVIGRPVGVN